MADLDIKSRRSARLEDIAREAGVLDLHCIARSE